MDAEKHALPARSRTLVGEPRRHQVTELPPIEAHITEYRCHRIVCPACGAQALLPDDVTGQFGPQLTALIAYLTVVCRLSRFRCCSIATEVLDSRRPVAERLSGRTPPDGAGRMMTEENLKRMVRG